MGPQSAGPVPPLGSKAISARAQDTVNLVSVPLRAGWNGVGLQSQQVTTLNSNAAIVGLATWNGSSYPSTNFSTESINAGAGGRRGFWAFANAATSFTYSGVDDGQGRFVDLPINGYNLVSFATSVPIPGASITASQNGQSVPLGSVVLLQFYEIGADNQYTLVDVLAGGTVQPGKAYWIFANTSSGTVRLNLPNGPTSSPTPVSSPGASPSPGTTVGSAVGLRLAQPPTSVAAGTNFPATITVEAIDSQGNRVTNAAGSVGLSQLSGSSSLYGTASKPLVMGVATFTGVQMSALSSMSRLRASFATFTTDSLSFQVSPELVSRNSDTAPTAVGSISAADSFVDGSNRQQTLSDDGRYAVFLTTGTTGGNAFAQVVRRDRQTGTTAIVSQHNGTLADQDCSNPAISPDGNFVAFDTISTFGGAFTSTSRQVYLRNLSGPTLQMVSASTVSPTTGSNGNSQSPQVSQNGAYVAYQSTSSNVPGGRTSGSIFQVYRFTSATSANQLVSRRRNGTPTDGNSSASFNPTIAGNGDFVAFDTNGGTDVLPLTAGQGSQQVLRMNMTTFLADLVSRRSGGSATEAGNGDALFCSLSADGRKVAFVSDATDLTAPATTGGQRQCFARDMNGGLTVLASQRAGGLATQGSSGMFSVNARISADGNFLVFQSTGTDLVTGVSRADMVYRRDLVTGTTVLISKNSAGTAASSPCSTPSSSGDGRVVLFAGQNGLGFTLSGAQVFVSLP